MNRFRFNAVQYSTTKSMVGTVRSDLIFFCPVDDEATLEAIADMVENVLTVECELELEPNTLL